MVVVRCVMCVGVSRLLLSMLACLFLLFVVAEIACSMLLVVG